MTKCASWHYHRKYSRRAREGKPEQGLDDVRLAGGLIKILLRLRAKPCSPVRLLAEIQRCVFLRIP